MKFASFLLGSLLLPLVAFGSNCVVNMSHYDRMNANFSAMKNQGVIGVIHEATYPRYDRDPAYSFRQQEATRAGLLWGAYHYGDATDPVHQADHFLATVSAAWSNAAGLSRPTGVLLVLDFEQNGHYPGGTMRPDQAATFVERIKQRTGMYPGLYGSENRLRAVLSARGVNPIHRQTIANCWLWIANYHWQPGSVDPWNHWHLWQYTGDGKCDLRPSSQYPKSVANISRAERNIFYGSSAEAVAFWQSHAWQPGPPSQVADR